MNTEKCLPSTAIPNKTKNEIGLKRKSLDMVKILLHICVKYHAKC